MTQTLSIDPQAARHAQAFKLLTPDQQRAVESLLLNPELLPPPAPATPVRWITQDGQRVYLPFDQVREAFFNQESGDACLFAALYADRVVYDHAAGEWCIWAGHYWQPDRTREIIHYVTDGVAAEYLYAAGDAQRAGNDDLSKDFAKRAALLRNRSRIESVLWHAAAHPDIRLEGEEWDNDPWVLGCENGVIDLKTGVLRPGQPHDYIKAHCHVEWQGLNAPAPMWEQFQKEITGEDMEIVAFKQRLYGFSITGKTTDHIFPILWGEEGRNGKGTELETIGKVLGDDLTTSTQADTLMDNDKKGDSPKPFMYGLRGKRLVWASESNEGRRLNSALAKLLTGGDTLEVRTNYMKRNVRFAATHTVFLMTNHKPHMNAEDKALWSRVVLIPYNLRFVDTPQAENERKRDPDLPEKLAGELSGVLAWLVRGCLEWRKHGMNVPAKLQAATEEYRQEEDTLGQFESECCVMGEKLEVRGGELYTAYKTWAIESGIDPMGKNTFGQRMKKRHKSKSSNGNWYVGIGLLSNKG